MSGRRGVSRIPLREEIAHSVIHGLGIVLSLAGLVALLVTAPRTGDAGTVVASGVYGFTLILLYLASTLYHSIPYPRAKRILRVLDHSAIYLLIAGTYTPFTLISLRGPWGWTLFGLVWGLAILGITLKVAAMGRFRGLSLVLYIGMGWLVLVALGPLVGGGRRAAGWSCWSSAASPTPRGSSSTSGAGCRTTMRSGTRSCSPAACCTSSRCCCTCSPARAEPPPGTFAPPRSYRGSP